MFHYTNFSPDGARITSHFFLRIGAARIFLVYACTTKHTPMKRTRTCPKCNSADIVEDAKMIDRGHGNYDAGELTVATYRSPKAYLFKGKRATSISAWVCARCGYLELYADSPEALTMP